VPNPKNYDNKDDWMGACMHQLKKNEGKGQDESVASVFLRGEIKTKRRKNVLLRY